jgi:hypothetical protein
MENLQIARKLGRTLVIPNVLIAPRNNKRILSEKHIYIKSLSLVPITNYLDLSEVDMRYVKLIPLAEFYEKTYNNPATVFYNPQKINVNEYIIDRILLTPFGKMDISKTQKINQFGLNILSNNDIYNVNAQNVIILENCRLGQPNWHDEKLGLDYFTIRMGLLFHHRLQKLANKYVAENNIRLKSTLMAHWRRGDRLLVDINKNKYEKSENETHQYYSNFTKVSCIENILLNILNIKLTNIDITQVFLVHNNADINELNLLINELKKFNINVIQYKNENHIENESDQDVSIIQQLIGAQCKYQLHGPTRYERMSAFGRWMIEERKRYYFNSQYIRTMEVFNNVYFLE